MHRAGMILLCLFLAGICLSACSGASQPLSKSAQRPTATRIPPTPTESPVWGAARGKVLFNTLQPEAGFACATCHYPGSDRRLIGPGLKNLMQQALNYNTGQTPQDYIRESIINPDAFIVPADPAYPAGLMPENYAEIFSEDDLKDLIAYLMTL